MYIKSLFLTLLINSLKYFNLLLNYTLIFENLSYDKNEQVCIISYQSALRVTGTNDGTNEKIFSIM